MAGIQTISLVFGFPALAMVFHELTHLAVARIAGPLSIERASWIPFRLRLDFDRMPSQAIFRVIALAPLLVGSMVALTAIQTGLWQQIKSADPYYFYNLMIAYWLLYIVPSPADVRLAIWPPTEDTHGVQRTHNEQPANWQINYKRQPCCFAINRRYSFIRVLDYRALSVSSGVGSTAECRN